MKKKRLIVACEFCRVRKMKCSSTRPCRNCKKHGIECRQPDRKPRGPQGPISSRRNPVHEDFLLLLVDNFLFRKEEFEAYKFISVALHSHRCREELTMEHFLRLYEIIVSQDFPFEKKERFLTAGLLVYPDDRLLVELCVLLYREKGPLAAREILSKFSQKEAYSLKQLELTLDAVIHLENPSSSFPYDTQKCLEYPENDTLQELLNIRMNDRVNIPLEQHELFLRQCCYAEGTSPNASRRFLEFLVQHEEFGAEKVVEAVERVLARNPVDTLAITECVRLLMQGVVLFPWAFMLVVNSLDYCPNSVPLIWKCSVEIINFQGRNEEMKEDGTIIWTGESNEIISKCRNERSWWNDVHFSLEGLAAADTTISVIDLAKCVWSKHVFQGVSSYHTFF